MNNEPVAWMYQIQDITGWTWVTNQRLPDYEYRNEKPLYTHPAKTLTEILATIKCIADDVSPHKEYENTYSDGWIDACNTVYDEVFAILKKASDK